MKKKKGLSLTTKSGLYGYVFLIPFLIGLVFIFLPCIIESLYYAFCDVQIGFGNIESSFVGIKNFKQAFMSDVEYRTILLDTVRGTVIDTVIIMFFSFFISNILNQKFHGRGLARTLFFLPVILSTGIIAAVDTATSADMTQMGSAVASAFGGDTLSSFFDLEEMLLSMNIPDSLTSVILYAIDNTYTIVNRSGVQILIFLSALQGISPSIFEAASIEGATPWEEFWKITFPMITPMILVNIVYTVVDSFTNPVYGMLDYVSEQAFSLNKMGYSSAISWVYFLIVLVLLAVIFKVTSKRITYTNR